MDRGNEHVEGNGSATGPAVRSRRAPAEIAGNVEAGPRPLAVEYRPAAALIPFAKNARTHSDAQVAQIAAWEFGWTNPVLVDGENGIIARHGRLLAARKLGMSTVPVIELAGLSEAQKRAYIIADNKMALNAGWDNELPGVEGNSSTSVASREPDESPDGFRGPIPVFLIRWHGSA